MPTYGLSPSWSLSSCLPGVQDEHHDADNDQCARNDGLGSHGTSAFMASIRHADGFLHQSSPLNDPDQHYDNGKHQQEVNESSHRVTAHQPKQPQSYQYDSNRPQHRILLFIGHGLTVGWYVRDRPAAILEPPCSCLFPSSFASSHSSCFLLLLHLTTCPFTDTTSWVVPCLWGVTLPLIAMWIGPYPVDR